MMQRNLLIVGAGSYGLVAYEIAKSMHCFNLISFIDDNRKFTVDNIEVLGSFDSITDYSDEYTDIVVAIGNPDVRYKLLSFIDKNTNFKICSLVSPLAYISPSAIVGSGSIIEAFASLNSGCRLGIGCIIASGAVVGHNSSCADCVHIDYNATVSSYAEVPFKTKLPCGKVFEVTK